MLPLYSVFSLPSTSLFCHLSTSPLNLATQNYKRTPLDLVATCQPSGRDEYISRSTLLYSELLQLLIDGLTVFQGQHMLVLYETTQLRSSARMVVLRMVRTAGEQHQLFMHKPCVSAAATCGKGDKAC